MKAFSTLELLEAKELAAHGCQSLHLHNIIVDPRRAPSCFVRDVNAGKPIAHLFDQDIDRLVKTARQLGVRVIVVEREGEPGQHIDLCGGPLAKAIALCDNSNEAREIARQFAESERTGTAHGEVGQ